MRRGIFDLAKAHAPIAIEALERISALYKIDERVRGQHCDHRQATRQAESKRLVADLRVWFETQIAKLPARGTTAEAIRYVLNHWSGIERFLEDGRIELDSNSIERAMRPVALSRKNSLFAGSDEGGTNWACMAPLIEICKLSGINPLTYLTELLTRLITRAHRRTDAVVLDGRIGKLTQKGLEASLTIDPRAVTIISTVYATFDAARTEGIALQVIKLPEAKRGFVLLPRRCVMEHSFA